MVLLAVDTCEARGGVAVRKDGASVGMQVHSGDEDYSEWLLPAVDRALSEAGIGMRQVEVLAVATGPGSFTGLRVGLTTVKAWAEVYGAPVVGVSRMEAIARQAGDDRRSVAVFCNAHRGQLFGAVYRRDEDRMARVGDEVVISPESFLQSVSELAGDVPVTWVSPDPQMITQLEGWQGRSIIGDVMQFREPQLSSSIAEIAEERAARGEFSDPLLLDANYVRRSDAEIFWKGTSTGGH